MISADAVLPFSGFFIAHLSLLFLDLHGWQQGLSPMHHARAWYFWRILSHYLLCFFQKSFHERVLHVSILWGEASVLMGGGWVQKNYWMRRGGCPPLWETLVSIIKNSAIFRHIHILLRNIQPYCGIFRTLHNCCIFRSLAYLEPKIYSELCQSISWHIQNTM